MWFHENLSVLQRYLETWFSSSPPFNCSSHVLSVHPHCTAMRILCHRLPVWLSEQLRQEVRRDLQQWRTSVLSKASKKISNCNYVRQVVLFYSIILGRLKGFFRSFKTKVSSQKDKRVQTRECGLMNSQLHTERISIPPHSQALVPTTTNLRLDSTDSMWWISVGILILSVIPFHCREELCL